MGHKADFRNQLKTLADVGDDTAVSLLRDLVIDHYPFEAPYAFDLLVDVKTTAAEDAIYDVMSAYPEQLGKEGLYALERTKSNNGLAHMANFVNLVEMDEPVRGRNMLHALDALQSSNNPLARRVTECLLQNNSDLPELRLKELMIRADHDADDVDAVRAIKDVALACPEYLYSACDILVDIGTQEARETYEAIQHEIDNPSHENEEPLPDELKFLKNMGIQGTRDDTPPPPAGPEI